MNEYVKSIVEKTKAEESDDTNSTHSDEELKTQCHR